MTARGIAAGLVCAVLVAAACSSRTPVTGEPTNALDRKLGAFSFIEEGDLVTFIVNTRATQYRDKEPYIPLEVCIANHGAKALSLSRESFTLVDAEGNRYPCAGPRELLESYDPLDLDRRLQELEDIVFNKFSTYVFYPSKFSPTRGLPVRAGASAVVRDNLTIPKFGFTIDLLYFPAPKTGIHKQKFELQMKARELPDTVYVKFMVL